MDLDKDCVANYHFYEKGTELNYKVILETITSLRIAKCVDPEWDYETSQDYQKSNKN